VIFDKKTGQLLGAHMVGAEVTELIQGYVVAMNLETTEEELMHTVFPHPTLSEMMKEAVLDAYGRVLNHNLSKAGKPLLVRYDLAGVKKALTKDALAQRPADLWRYREMLPVRKVADIVSLGEAMTPLIRLPKLAKKLGGGEIIVKDEGRLPTGSFKARGLVMAVSMGKALGIKHMAMPTNGNAGAALAAYATAAASRPRSSVRPTRRK
jgi:hypothetical protein